MHMQKYVIASDSSATKNTEKRLNLNAAGGWEKAVSSSVHNIYKLLKHCFNHR